MSGPVDASIFFTQAELSKPADVADDFGKGLGMDEDDLVVLSSTFASFYEKSVAGEWVHTQLIHVNETNSSNFAQAKVQRQRAMLTAFDESEGAGVVIHVAKKEFGWTVVETLRLPAEMSTGRENFGTAVAFTEDCLAVGSPTSGQVPFQGLILVYSLVDGRWRFEYLLEGTKSGAQLLGTDLVFADSFLLSGTGNSLAFGSSAFTVKFPRDPISGKPADIPQLVPGPTSPEEYWGLRVLVNERLGLEFYNSPLSNAEKGKVHVYDSTGPRQEVVPFLGQPQEAFSDAGMAMLSDLLFIPSPRRDVAVSVFGIIGGFCRLSLADLVFGLRHSPMLALSTYLLTFRETGDSS